MPNRQLTLDEIHEPPTESRRRGREQSRRNWDWLQAHWPELLPRAHGKFLAVANEEAFVSDTLEAALAWVRTTHAEDDGHIVEYVLPPTGPRIYSGIPC